MADSEDAEKIDDFLIETLRTASAKNSNPIITAIQSLERKTFPSSESLTIQTEISKRNTYILVARLPGSTVPVIGYLIYINTFAGLRIHKVCVGEKFRRRGVAKKLIQCVCDTAKKTGKDIDLWVDENRIGAIQCYTTCGFRQVADVVVDYYGPARNGDDAGYKASFGSAPDSNDEKPANGKGGLLNYTHILADIRNQPMQSLL